MNGILDLPPIEKIRKVPTQINLPDERKFDEIVSYFNKKVSEMEIETKYKMELLGMVTALGYAHEKETHGNARRTHARDCIDRQAAIDALRTCQTYLFNTHDPDKKISLESAEYEIELLPSAQPEIVRCKDCKHWEGEYRNGFWYFEQCSLNEHVASSEDFCSWAERREG